MLLPDAREILELSASARRRLAGATGALRVGYVSWLPDELPDSAALDIRVDEWVMSSHVQIGRVVDGGLDAAVAWAGARNDRLDFRLLWPEPLVAEGGVRAFPDALLKLFAGANIGKLIVAVAHGDA